MLEVGDDFALAAILDEIRPIQHRVTLVQADATATTLEALARDPHPQVRQVVASHPNITEEVCFRLSEEQNGTVRRALRKNPGCHPWIAAAIEMTDGAGPRDPALASPEHLLEIAWQARRAKLSAKELVELCEEWTGLGQDQLVRLELTQAQLLLDVLAAKLGKGKMPTKPRARASSPKRKKKAKRGAARR